MSCMASRHVVCTRTQKPGNAEWIVLYPGRNDVKTTIFGTRDEIEAGVKRQLAELYPGEEIELSFRDVQFRDIFGF